MVIKDRLVTITKKRFISWRKKCVNPRKVVELIEEFKVFSIPPGLGCRKIHNSKILLKSEIRQKYEITVERIILSLEIYHKLQFQSELKLITEATSTIPDPFYLSQVSAKMLRQVPGILKSNLRCTRYFTRHFEDKNQGMESIYVPLFDKMSDICILVLNVSINLRLKQITNNRKDSNE